jgi:hypothetical protein
MADRYNDWERRRWRDVDDDSDLYYRGGRGRDFESLRNEYYGTGYQGGRRPQRFDRRGSDNYGEEFERPDYARSNRPDRYGRHDYGRGPSEELADRGDYARGDYGYRRTEGDYTRDFGWRGQRDEWRPTLPPAYRQRRGGRYRREERSDWSPRRGPTQRDLSRNDWYQGDWRRGEDYGTEQPRPADSFSDYWLTPGPHTGRGPRDYQRSNERIVEDVCERITHHGYLDASDIEVEADEGIVRLKGMVDSRRAKRLAEDTAETVMGVWDVDNRLQIRRDNGQEQQEEQMEMTER